MNTAVASPLNSVTASPFTAELVMARDGHVLAARYYRPAQFARGAVLIVPAMGVPQSYYTPFAGWLAGQGYHVMTFDYRGMGESLQGALRDVEADVMTWARLDVAAVLQKLTDRSEGLPLTWIGHSLGGQILPFVPGHERVARMITVGTGSGYWRENSPPLRRRVWLLWFVVAPATMPVFGYFPGSRFNMVGDLPRGVMTQWRRWCLHPEYAVGVEGETVRRQYAQVTLPIVSLSFTDDEFMSARNTESIHGFYVGAPREMVRLSPATVGVKRIGHFGFFRREMQQPLWEKYLLPWLA